MSRCCRCKKVLGDDCGGVDFCVVNDPKRHRFVVRGYLCTEHQRVFAADGLEVRVVGKVAPWAKVPGPPPDSATTAEYKRERAIKRERMELRHAEREARRADREERLRRRGLARRANIRVRANGDYSMRDAIHARETWFCKLCKTAKPSTEMIAQDICYQCHYGEGV